MEHEYEDEYDEDGNSLAIDISEFIGKTFTKITGANPSSGEIRFVAKSTLWVPPTQYLMYHVQECCEQVSLADVCGDIEDLINTPIVNAYKTSKTFNPALVDIGHSSTWTFYRLATIKGTVTLRWHGSSNGYYSEEVSIFRVNNATTN